MEEGIFGYIFRYSRKQQIALLMFSLFSFPFLYFSLDIPKTIINKAIGGTNFPQDILGTEYDQTSYLLIMCAVFLALVMINGGFKYCINVYRGILSERMLRRLRFMLIERITRFPLPHFRNVSQGEIVSMVALETEPLGGFIGDSVSLLAFQGGTLVTIVGFMFAQDMIMGLAAVSLYPIQAYFIPKLQRQVNLLGKERVKNVRKLSERVGELVSGMADIRSHDTVHFELADFSERLGTIFDIRFQIYRKKYLIKFLNNFLAQLTPFFFFSIGGYLVINGELTLGSLVAVLAAYKDLSAPWKALLNYYQRMEDARIKYRQLVEQFQPTGILAESLMAPQLNPPEKIEGKLIASNLSFEVDEGNRIIDGATFSINISEHVAITGDGSNDRAAVAQLLARMIMPTGGKIQIGEKSLATLSSAAIGRNFAYVDDESYIRSGTILDALLYGLKHHPTKAVVKVGEERGIRVRKIEESVISGNSPFSIDDEWVDFESIGVAGHGEVIKRTIHVLGTVGLSDDIFRLGLRQVVNADDNPELVAGILRARTVIGDKMGVSNINNLVEVFDKNKFIANASVAENILFGAPVGDQFRIKTLGGNPYVLWVLEKVGLRGDFLRIGHAIAELMVELFHGLSPGHEFFERFGFIDSDDLPEFQRINNHIANHGMEGLNDADQCLLSDLPFKMIVARHRLGLIDDNLQARILEARKLFSDNLPESSRQSVAFFDIDQYNAASSIQDNILFGKIACDKAESASIVGDIMTGVIDELDLRTAIIEAGLAFDVGIAGKRLSVAQRQKIAIARCLLKQPRMMIVNQATTALDTVSSNKIMENIRTEMKDAGLVWVDSDIASKKSFDHILRVERGKVIELAEDDETRPVESSRLAEAGPAESKDAAGALNDEANLLEDIPFFKGIERSRLKLLAFTSDRLKFDKGQYLFWQGNMAEEAYMILEGSVNVIIDSLDGPKTIATAHRGELIGELAMLSDAPRTASVMAAEPISVMSISKDIFIKLISENSEVSSNLTRLLAGRFESMMRQFGGGQALYDKITGLPNSDLLKDRMKYMASTDKRNGRMSALIMIDMESNGQFKGAMESHHKDEFLKEIARRLRGCLREADTLARLNGYGFGVIANAAATDSGLDTKIIIKRLTGAFNDPFVVADDVINIEEELGIKVLPLTEENIRIAEDLL